MDREEVNYGKLRKNDWKWNPEVDRLLAYYQDKFCECGCGVKLNPTRKQVRDNKYKNKPLRVLKGHHNRLPEINKLLPRGESHPFYGKHHTPESLAKMSKKTSGEKNPNWKGGISRKFPYRRGWGRIRKTVLSRDGYTCQQCQKKEELGKLHVHHLVDRKLFHSADKAHQLTNLITLCRKCHLVIEAKKQRKQGELLEHPAEGQSAAKPRDSERLLEGSTIRTEETIMSTSALLKLKT